MTKQNTAVQAAQRPSLLFGLGGLVLIFAFTTAWVYLGGRVLHLQSFYASGLGRRGWSRSARRNRERCRDSRQSS